MYQIILIIEAAVSAIVIVLIFAVCLQTRKLKKHTKKESVIMIEHANKTKDSLKLQPNEMTLDEKLLTLSTDQHRFFTSILNYAMGKENAEGQQTKYFITVRAKKKTILKLSIRRDTTLASFKFENDLLKDYKRNAGSDASNIRQKETQILITDEGKMQTALRMIDLMLEQHELDRKAEKERKRALKAAKRAHAQQAQS